MEFEVTQGFIMVGLGMGGMAISLIGGIVAAIVMRGSRKKLQRRLDEVYKA